jgi:tryptophanyl-tRNA synthetase
MRKGRILSGMRPSGKLHIGHLIGVLNNWARLQDEYECFYMIADWHALTSEYADTSELKNNARDMLVDWLACGLDPDRSVLFQQSHVKQHAELFLLFSMIAPLGWLEGCPTYKEQMNEVKNRDLSTYGFLGYPVLQAADILVYNADSVPVGEDQLPHVELTREIARRFNKLYATEEKPVFVEPKALLSTAPRLSGTDGRKMSKSYNNCIYLFDDDKAVAERTKMMFTDPVKLRKNDKGHPDGCVVFSFHKVCTPGHDGLEKECRAGEIGCVDCKSRLAININKTLEPVRQRRSEILKKGTGFLEGILESGRAKAESVAEKVMRDVRASIKID